MWVCGSLFLLLGLSHLAVGNDCPVRILSHQVMRVEDDDSYSPDYPDESTEAGTIIRTTNNNSGVIESSVFKPASNTNPKCSFIFLGAPDERVQITFVEFGMGQLNASGRCEEFNHVSSHVLVRSRMSKVQDFCGNELPPPVMSTQNLLTLEMVLRDIGTSAAFKLRYQFIKGLGKQANEAFPLPNPEDCSFIFNGSVQTAGELWSPNHPGFYPRNLNCEYVFHGKTNQIVLIHFEYFDVEGYGQCDDSTHSDFVLFSNYKTVDRTNRRFCGQSRPPRQPIQSESSYFRMQFKSNDIFDATGFYIYYQFLDPGATKKKRVKLTASSQFHNRPSRIAVAFLIWLHYTLLQ